MSKSVDEAPAPGPDAVNGSQAKAASGGGFVREWVVPIGLGLAIGSALVGLWNVRGHVLNSKAWNIVVKHQDGEAEVNDELAKELRTLGPTARADLVEAMRDVPGEQMEAKAWVAGLLAGEPWFDTTTLKEILKDPKAKKEDRRAAAVALFDAQQKEVDPELILPVFEEWTADAGSLDRGMAVDRLDVMWRSGMLSSAWEARIRKALIDLGRRVPSAKPEDAERLAEDRGRALLTLKLALPDDEVKKLLWSVAKDDTDEEVPRVNSLRALSEGGVMDASDVDDWAAAGKATNPTVRQTVADNLFRTPLPVYDKVLDPLFFDANPLARSGAIDTQIKRRRPSVLKRFDELLEDSWEWTRFGAMYAAGVFKNETEGLAPRAAMMLRLVETSDDPVDVMGAVIAMKMITDEVYGLEPNDVKIHEQFVEETALRTFMADTAGRKQAADKWRAKFGAGAVWTDEDRIRTLEKVTQHADEKNVERAKALIDELRGGTKSPVMPPK